MGVEILPASLYFSVGWSLIAMGFGNIVGFDVIKATLDGGYLADGQLLCRIL